MTTCYKNTTDYIHLLPLYKQLVEIDYLTDHYSIKHLKINLAKRFSILNHLKEHKRIATATFIAQFFPDRICSGYYVRVC